MKMNKNQQYAVNNTEGPLLILAGAGAGKTRVITTRIAHMIKDLNISPASILAVTFTAKAANEMQERVEDMLNMTGIQISTFHSFSLKLLRQYINNTPYSPNFKIIDTFEQMKIINGLIRQLNLKKDIDLTTYQIASSFSFRKETGLFNYLGVNGPTLHTLYNAYNEYLIRNNKLDFADILVQANKLLDIPLILSKTQEQYKYIMVDEYQDTNRIQFSIINKIANKYKNICAVGDENQSIYGFRGANIKNILNFKDNFEGCKVCKLDINYRSSKNIVEASNSVIMHNTERTNKKISANRPAGDKITIKKFKSIYDECQYIAKEIIKAQLKGEYNNCILYRTNTQARAMEETLIGFKIPYQINKSTNFYDNPEIKTLFTLLSFVANPNDCNLFFKSLNCIKQTINKEQLENLAIFADNNNMEFFYAMNYYESFFFLNSKQKMAIKQLINIVKQCNKIKNISDKLEIILSGTNYIQYLEEFSVEPDKKKANIEELKDSIIAFESDNNNLKDYLTHINALRNTDKISNDKCVNMMTIHASKGLEFNNVFIIGCDEKTIPYSLIKDAEVDIEEERRLFYVAMTRAKNKLFLTYAYEKIISGKIEVLNASPFIDEIDNKYIKKDKINKVTLNTTKPLTIKKCSETKQSNFEILDEVIHPVHGKGIITKNIGVVEVIFKNLQKRFEINIANQILKLSKNR